jgi:hypothetical protein
MILNGLVLYALLTIYIICNLQKPQDKIDKGGVGVVSLYLSEEGIERRE